MTDTATSGRPRRILLATDLSSRCDRALDRAISLAGEWSAELIAATIVEPVDVHRQMLDTSPPRQHAGRSPVQRMRRRLERDLADAAGPIRALVEEGDPAEALLSIAEREQCDLIVTGVARDETLGRILLGGTVNRLVRGSRAPVLIVHDRARRPYARIALATDFSDASMQALLATAQLFPHSALTLFHAYEVPFHGLLDEMDFSTELERLETDLCRKFLADARVGPALRSRADIVVRHGSPEGLLPDFIEERAIDLTVIGSHGRGALFDTLIGSTARRLIDSLEGDLLVVRATQPPG